MLENMYMSEEELDEMIEDILFAIDEYEKRKFNLWFNSNND